MLIEGFLLVYLSLSSRHVLARFFHKKIIYVCPEKICFNVHFYVKKHGLKIMLNVSENNKISPKMSDPIES